MHTYIHTYTNPVHKRRAAACHIGVLHTYIHTYIQFAYIHIHTQIQCTSDELRLAILASSKLAFVVKLIRDLKANGHKTLIFSQSVRLLDILYQCLKVAGVR